MHTHHKNPFGLGVSDIDDVVWLTSHMTGAVVFHGTACQLNERADLTSGLTANQIAVLELQTQPA